MIACRLNKAHVPLIERHENTVNLCRAFVWFALPHMLCAVTLKSQRWFQTNRTAENKASVVMSSLYGGTLTREQLHCKA